MDLLLLAVANEVHAIKLLMAVLAILLVQRRGICLPLSLLLLFVVRICNRDSALRD